MTYRSAFFLIAISAVSVVPALAGLPFIGHVSSAFALVDTDGTLVRGRNALTVNHQQSGAYEVNFDHNVSRCVYTASLTATADGEAISPGGVTVASGADAKSAVQVFTFDPSGVAADRAFSLNVRCLKGILL